MCVGVNRALLYIQLLNLKLAAVSHDVQKRIEMGAKIFFSCASENQSR